MNADEIKTYLAENQLEDSWWVLKDGGWLESMMTLAQIEQLDGTIQLLHVTQAEEDPPPTIDFQKKAGLFAVAKKAAVLSASAIPSNCFQVFKP